MLNTYLDSKVDLIYIKNIHKGKVLGTKSDDEVILEVFEEGKAEQLWKKEKPNAEGYSTLVNSKVPKIMTAISSSIIRIIGNIRLRLIVKYFLMIYIVFFFLHIGRQAAIRDSHGRVLKTHSGSKGRHLKLNTGSGSGIYPRINP